MQRDIDEQTLLAADLWNVDPGILAAESDRNRRTVRPTYNRIVDALEAADSSSTIERIRRFQAAITSEFVTRHHEFGGNLMSPGLETSEMVPAELRDLRPDNPIAEMVRTWMPYLAADGFKPKVDARMGTNRLAAAIQTVRLHRVCADMDMPRVAQELVLDSLFGMSVARVRICSPNAPQPYGAKRFDEDQPYVRRVPMDSWIFDPTCEGYLDRAMYVADEYIVDREEFIDLVPSDVRDRLKNIPNVWETNRYRADERLFTADLIRLIDVEFQAGGRRFVATVAHWDERQDGWIVPPFEHGPDHETSYVPMVLGFVPGAMQPVSPALHMLDAHIATTVLAGRATEEGFTVKRFTLADPAVRQQIAALMQPKMDSIVFCNPNATRNEVRGGMVNETTNAHSFARMLAMSKGPNMAQGRGYGSGSNTATGEGINAGNIGVILKAWQEPRDAAFSAILSRIAWWINSIPKPMLDVPITLPDGTKTVAKFDPMMPVAKDLSYQDLQYRAITGAQTAMDPRQRARTIIEMLPLLEQSLLMVQRLGGNVPATLDMFADRFELPELASILPTDNAEGLLAAIRKIVEEGSRGGGGGGGGVMGGMNQTKLGPESRVGQQLSDYASGRM